MIDLLKLFTEAPAAALLGAILAALVGLLGGWLTKSREFRVQQALRLADEGVAYAVHVDRHVDVLFQERERHGLSSEELPDLNPAHPLMYEGAIRYARADVTFPSGFRVWFYRLNEAAIAFATSPDEGAAADYTEARREFFLNLRKVVVAQRGFWWQRLFRRTVDAVLLFNFLWPHRRQIWHNTEALHERQRQRRIRTSSVDPHPDTVPTGDVPN